MNYIVNNFPGRERRRRKPTKRSVSWASGGGEARAKKATRKAAARKAKKLAKKMKKMQ